MHFLDAEQQQSQGANATLGPYTTARTIPRTVLPLLDGSSAPLSAADPGCVTSNNTPASRNIDLPMNEVDLGSPNHTAFTGWHSDPHRDDNDVCVQDPVTHMWHWKKTGAPCNPARDPIGN